MLLALRLFLVQKKVYDEKHHITSGADSIPKASQAARAAPADRAPVRFTSIGRCDVNEPEATLPRGCAWRPEGPRLGP